MYVRWSVFAWGLSFSAMTVWRATERRQCVIDRWCALLTSADTCTGSCMITLSPRAAAQVRSMQSELGSPDKLLRVFVETGGCSGFQYGMSFDEPKADDTHLESEGVALVMDPASLSYLKGSHIDFDDGLQGKGFEIKNPNAQSTCGCGKSFS